MSRISSTSGMPFRRLFFFLEGDDDERFFRAVLFPLLRMINE